MSVSASSSGTSVIGLHNVLLGRSSEAFQNPGNRRFRRLINQKVKRFDSTARFQKRLVVLEVLDAVHDHGGKFLKQNKETKRWEEVPLKEAKLKVSHALRDALCTQKWSKEKEKEQRRKADVSVFHSNSTSLQLPPVVELKSMTQGQAQQGAHANAAKQETVVPNQIAFPQVPPPQANFYPPRHIIAGNQGGLNGDFIPPVSISDAPASAPWQQSSHTVPSSPPTKSPPSNDSELPRHHDAQLRWRQPDQSVSSQGIIALTQQNRDSSYYKQDEGVVPQPVPDPTSLIQQDGHNNPHTVSPLPFIPEAAPAPAVPVESTFLPIGGEINTVAPTFSDGVVEQTAGSAFTNYPPSTVSDSSSAGDPAHPFDDLLTDDSSLFLSFMGGDQIDLDLW